MELYQNPVSLRAADFIGNPRINFVDGKAEKDADGNLLIHSDLGRHVFPKELFTEEMPAQTNFDCAMGIRPEKLAIRETECPGGMPALVYSVQPAGSETIVTVHAGNTSLLVKEIGIKSYKVDQPVWLETDNSKVIVFYRETGRLIKKAVPD
jgi:multiple sugar transport system ATP-binding protein